jgi:hypothetical protein
MITLEDCVALCGLTEQEVLAIAEHEHLPEIASAALASYLVHQEKYGLNRVRDMLSMTSARRKRVVTKSMFWFSFIVLHHFLRVHPEAQPQQHPWSHCF